MKTKIVVRIAFVLVAVAVALLLVRAKSSDAGSPAEPVESTPEKPAFALDVVSLALSNPTNHIKLPGDLMAWNETKIYAKVKSFVKTLHADRGTRVHKGQLLATLEAPELLADVNKEKSRVNEFVARYQASRASYLRLLQSSATVGAVAQNELDLAQSQMLADSASLKSSQAAYESIRELTQYLQVTAPYDGIIAYRGISPGSLVGPEDITKDKPLFILEDGHTLRLTLAVPEKYVDELIEGSQVSFTVDAIPNEQFHCTLTRESKKVEQDVRSMMVEFDVPNADGRLKPGMYADVTLPIQRTGKTYNIPSSALLNSTLGVFVIAVVDGKAKWIPVSTGNLAPESIEVFGDLEPGMKLIKAASEEVRDGAPVNVRI